MACCMACCHLVTSSKTKRNKTHSTDALCKFCDLLSTRHFDRIRLGGPQMLDRTYRVLVETPCTNPPQWLGSPAKQKPERDILVYMAKKCTILTWYVVFLPFDRTTAIRKKSAEVVVEALSVTSTEEDMSGGLGRDSVGRKQVKQKQRRVPRYAEIVFDDEDDKGWVVSTEFGVSYTIWKCGRLEWSAGPHGRPIVLDVFCSVKQPIMRGDTSTGYADIEVGRVGEVPPDYDGAEKRTTQNVSKANDASGSFSTCTWGAVFSCWSCVNHVRCLAGWASGSEDRGKTQLCQHDCSRRETPICECDYTSKAAV